jgi:AraC-like DNA-binding protein/ABC-type sugar transport system substrate-binding protein
MPAPRNAQRPSSKTSAEKRLASRLPRIGLWIGADEPFFVQVRVALERAALKSGVEIVFLDDGFDSSNTSDEWREVVADIAASSLDLFVCNFLPLRSLEAILAAGLPVVHLGETKVRHPQLVSLEGLFDAGRAGGLFLGSLLPLNARVLVVGGGYPYPESGLARLEGAREGLQRRSDVTLQHLPTEWPPELARPVLESALNEAIRPWDAIFALSDPLALLVRELASGTLALGTGTLLLGINGDPLALAAITRGELTATVDVDPERIGERAVALALRLATGQALPQRFDVAARLVTRDNVTELTTRKLVALAELPSRLVGVNLERERNRQAKLEVSLEIGQRIARTLERSALVCEVPEDVRFAFGYDAVEFYGLLADGTLQLEFPALHQPRRVVQPRDPRDPLSAALLEHRALLIADTRRSSEFDPDPRLPEVRARTVLPVEAGGVTFGVLDLHAAQSAPHSRQELIALRWIADQFGAALRHADLLERRSTGIDRTTKPVKQPSRSARRTTSSAAASQHGDPQRMLLAIDPSLRVREVYRRLLHQPNNLIHTAADGAEALEALERETPALVILESALPKVDGFSVLAWMRGRARLSGVPVLMLSSSPLRTDDTKLLDHARVTWLAKHVLSNAEILERIERLLIGETLSRRPSLLVKRCLAVLHSEYRQPISRDELAAALEVTPNHLSHLFKTEIGLTPWTYLNRVRINASKDLLRSSGARVADIAQQVGFEDPSYFARVFSGWVGQTPHGYRQRPTADLKP